MVLQQEAGELFEGLKNEFESTFGELIPGIIHDLASPLNGIMGRCELLERRAHRTLERIAAGAHTAGNDLMEDCQKIHADANLLTREADRLFDLFNKVSEKFRTLKDTAVQEINLSDLVETEVRFLRFYPEIKHTVEHTLHLDREVPEVRGIRADYSMALSAIIRHAIDSMMESESRKLVITTGYDDSHVFIRVEDTGAPREAIREGELPPLPAHTINGNRGLFCAVSLLKKHDVLFGVAHESGVNITSLRVPY